MCPSTDPVTRISGGGRSPRPAALLFGLLLLVVSGLAGRTALAATNGVLTVQWNLNTTDTDLAGYRVFISTDSSIFTLTPAAAQPLATTRTVSISTTSTSFTSLDTTLVYYVAVTAFDTSGNQSVFSNVASATPGVNPVLSSVSPTAGTEGNSNLAVTLNGTNFQSGATVAFGPGVTVTSVDASGVPSRLVARVSIDPLAEVDNRDIVVTNPGGYASTLANAFAVRIEVGRVDVNQSNRIDGGDLVALAASFTARAGQAAYSTALDMNVDGVIDGTDLALLITYFGLVGPF
jgi:dockerin type I repeat protein